MIKKLSLSLFLLFLPLLAFGASISTLTDNFDDNSVDEAKWDYDVSNVTVAETNNELEFTTNGTSGYANFYSVSTYDLTGSQATIKVVAAGNLSATGYDFFPLHLYKDSTHKLKWEIYSDGKIYAVIVNTSTTYPWSATYVAATHKYLRIRESGGTTYWDYSADGINWTNAYSVANPFAVTAFYGEIDMLGGGATTTTAKVDDFNILPSSPNGATTYTSDDANARTATFYNSAQLSTAQKKFGSASLLLVSATSDYLTFPDSDDWAFGLNDLTIGWRFRASDLLSGSFDIWKQYVDADNYISLKVEAYTASMVAFYLDVYSGGSALIGIGQEFNYSENTFYYLELVRSATLGQWILFLNGSIIMTRDLATYNVNIPNFATTAFMDGNNCGSLYIDELYIIKGQALHTSMYEPLDVEYSLSADVNTGAFFQLF
jgi:regulation of enolase protein 1 (concanavalin A-like superfamily)